MSGGEKSRVQIIKEKAKTCYENAVRIIGDLEENVFSKREGFAYTRSQLFADYDAFLQAVLIKICVSHGEFGEEEMDFIETIADYGKLVDGMDFSLFAGCGKEMRDKIGEKADERLTDIPVCIKLSAAVDSGRNTGVTKALLDDTARIAFLFKYLRPEGEEKNNEDVSAALKSVYVFLNANGIPLK